METTSISGLDAPTLRKQLDGLITDTKMLANSIAERHALVQKLNNEIEQYRGAAAYNAKLVDELTKMIAS